MILLLLLVSVAFGVFVYRSASRPWRWLSPVSGAALFLIGWAVVHGPVSNAPPKARTQEISNTTQPLIATQIDPVTMKPTLSERAAPKTGKPPAPKAAAGLSDRTRQLIWIEKSKDGIRARLKDPDSAQFKEVFFSTFENIPVVCGQVNSKNGLGGYTGYQRFIASGNGLEILQDDMEPSEFAKSWSQMCVGR